MTIHFLKQEFSNTLLNLFENSYMCPTQADKYICISLVVDRLDCGETCQHLTDYCEGQISK